MKKLLLLMILFISMSTFSQTYKDSITIMTISRDTVKIIHKKELMKVLDSLHNRDRIETFKIRKFIGNNEFECTMKLKLKARKEENDYIL